MKLRQALKIRKGRRREKSAWCDLVRYKTTTIEAHRRRLRKYWRRGDWLARHIAALGHWPRQ